MPTYEVTWTQVIAAKDHRNAAEKALAIMHKAKDPKRVMVVTARNGSRKTIDLADDAGETDEED